MTPSKNHLDSRNKDKILALVFDVFEHSYWKTVETFAKKIFAKIKQTKITTSQRKQCQS